LDHLSALQRDLVCVDLDDTVSDSDLCLDQIAVSRVLDNLLENSLRFASDGSQFFIGASIQNHTLTLHVHDQGPPLAINGDASLLFDRFTRLEEHRDPSQTDGVGLGLAVVKSLVEGMGGAVKAEFSSDQAGEKPSGLQISLMFPRVNPTAG
jgi:K+-sensing histidine kinase KdpD